MREEEKKRTSQNSNWQRLMKKRWVFPAIYLASAALILTAVLMFQAGNQEVDPIDETEGQGPTTSYNDEDAVEVNRPLENFKMPVTDVNSVVVKKQFWDADASEEEQEASFVYFNGIYQPNTGIDIAMKNEETFDVVAALSGTVTRAEEDSLLGNIVEIDHSDGVKTVYQALSDVTVKPGDVVEQGQKIAKAGTSEMNKELVHVHFEIRKDSVAVNPIEYFNKPVTALLDEEGQTSEESSNPAGEKEETPAPGEDKPEDGEEKEDHEDHEGSEGHEEENVSYLT
ncbi:M23 family metallopeptidase [Sutcliffiella halmapala]|uniref:M23 family metallopeptidase n=1 Tax=Sutcliffiella halmapala TaxID=79882 RepID=UPI0009953924|nr:M23 family metallopeptidase [Sutcliffiella halmapala]